MQTLAFTQASAGRGAFLSFGYCLGLGIPFVLTALRPAALGRARSTSSSGTTRWCCASAAACSIVVGLLLVSGIWQDLMIQLRGTINGFTPAV